MSATASPLTPAEQRRWTNIGILAALALLLSYAETFVPIPIPGIKLGLANIPVLVCLAREDITGACSISAIKVLASGLLFGSPITMLYAGTGTVFALVGMVPLSRLKTMRLWMVSVVGALLHVMGQLLVASWLLGSPAVWRVSPLLFVAACITGAFCGVVATSLEASLAQFDHLPIRDAGLIAPRRPPMRTLAGFCMLIAFIVLTLHLSKPKVLGTCTIVALLCCAATRVPLRKLLGAIRPLAALLALTFVMQYVLSPQTALPEALRAVLRLAAIAAASTAFMQLTRTTNPTPSIAWVLQPLTRLGIRTQGFVCATSIALRLVPELSDALHNEMSHLQGHPTLRQMQQVLPRLMQSLYDRIEKQGS